MNPTQCNNTANETRKSKINSFCALLPNCVRDDLEGAGALFAADIEMGDETHEIGANAVGEKTVGGEAAGHFGGSHAAGGYVAHQNVGLHAGGVNLEAGQLRESFGEEAGVGVVGGQLAGAMLEGDDPGGCEDAGLAHASAQGLAANARAVDEVGVADKQRTDGRAQSFGQAEHDGVGFGGEFGDGDVESDGGVKDAGAVEMHGQSGLMGAVADFVEDLGWSDGASGDVVGVLEPDETGRGRVIAAGP